MGEYTEYLKSEYTKSDRKAVKWWGPKPITVTFTPNHCIKAQPKWRPMGGAGLPGVQ